jgi:hypothetical protein
MADAEPDPDPWAARAGLGFGLGQTASAGPLSAKAASRAQGMARLQANLDRDPTIPPGLGVLGTKLAAKREGLGTAAVPFPGMTAEELLQEFPDAGLEQVQELLKLQTQNHEMLKQLQRRRRDMTRAQLNSIGERRTSLASGAVALSFVPLTLALPPSASQS